MSDSNTQEETQGATVDFDMSQLTPTRAKKATTAAVEALAGLTRLPLRGGNVNFWKGVLRAVPVTTSQRVAIRVTITVEGTELPGLLLAERRLAVSVVNSMIGEDAKSQIETFEDLHRSVLAEALGGVATALQDSLSSQFGSVQVSPSPGVYEADQATLDGPTCVFAGVELIDNTESAGWLGLVVAEAPLADLIARINAAKATATASASSGFPATHFPQLSSRSEGSGEIPQNLGLLLDVPMQLVAVLGRRSMKLREVLQMGAGSVLELDKLAGEPLELLINGKLIGFGEVIVADDKFGIKVRDVVNAEDRLRSARL